MMIRLVIILIDEHMKINDIVNSVVDCCLCGTGKIERKALICIEMYYIKIKSYIYIYIKYIYYIC